MCLPHNCGCEMIHQGLIAQPSAFWSSLFYFLAGFFLLFQVRKSFELYIWIGITTLLGLSSMFTHASFTNLAVTMDFSSIMLILCFHQIMKLSTELKISKGGLVLVFVSQYVTTLLMFTYLGFWLKVSICFILFCLAVHGIIKEVGLSFKKAYYLKGSFAFAIVGFFFFLVDEAGIFCNSESWIQGHGLWHFGSAVGIYLFGHWQFKERILETIKHS